MEELAETLATSFQVSNFPNNPHAPHPRFSQYKAKKNTSQEERRKQLLALQKVRRHNYLSHVRGLAEGNWSEALSDEDPDKDEVQKAKEKEICEVLKKVASEEPMELRNGKKDVTDPTNDELEEPMELALQKVVKPPKSYKNQLMMSEWLVEIPEDMASNWLLLLCPVGKRSLVVTANGSTRAYTKSGYCVNQFPSYLPGGNRKQQLKSKDYTILDTIFSETDRTFYVLDLMCWRGHPVFNSETEFRFYWLSTKLEEVPEVKQHSSLNPFRFVALPHYVCSAAAMEAVMYSPLPFSLPLDGLLFYNKETHYMHGPTPLVGWLKAYMLPELLGIKVPDNYLSERPANYICMEQHLKVPKTRKMNLKKEQPMQTETNTSGAEACSKENVCLMDCAKDTSCADAHPEETTCPEECPEQNVYPEASPHAGPPEKVKSRSRRRKNKKKRKKVQPMQVSDSYSADEPTEGDMCSEDQRTNADSEIKGGNLEQCQENNDLPKANDMCMDEHVSGSVTAENGVNEEIISTVE